MSRVMLRLEAFAGSSLQGAIEDAVTTAARCGCWAKINVNGIDVLISPDDRAAAIWANYQLAREHRAKFVSANLVPSGGRADG